MRWDREGTLPPTPLTEIIAENRWVAQRYGVLAFFGDATRGILRGGDKRGVPATAADPPFPLDGE